MVEHSGLSLDITPNDLYDRYLLYGGIVHHVVAPTLMQKQIKKDLIANLENLDLSILQKKGANVDHDAWNKSRRKGRGSFLMMVFCDIPVHLLNREWKKYSTASPWKKR